MAWRKLNSKPDENGVWLWTAPPLDKHGEIRGRDPFDPLADPAYRLTNLSAALPQRQISTAWAPQRIRGQDRRAIRAGSLT